ncbi:MAG TPA: AbrB/MazE/SpoVT family DNA-binding domain-containing protein [Phycisphaerae bacterium]|nr:AbrB/MazE/SpoVT family DNA-binding domain-containing protein [Phycisphaerae bacterium]
MAVRSTVQMWGNTRAVRIPKMLAQEVGFQSGTEVTWTKSARGLLLQPVRAKKRYKLSQLLAQCKGKNPHREMIRDRAGREIL